MSNNNEELTPYRQAYVGMGPTYLGSETVYLSPDVYQQRVLCDEHDEREIIRATVFTTLVAAAAGGAIALFGGSGIQKRRVEHKQSGRPVLHRTLTHTANQLLPTGVLNLTYPNLEGVKR